MQMYIVDINIIKIFIFFLIDKFRDICNYRIVRNDAKMNIYSEKFLVDNNRRFEVATF